MTLTIAITNDETGTNQSANYRYVVVIGHETIHSGKIRGHDRHDGWVALLKLLVAQCEEAEVAKNVAAAGGIAAVFADLRKSIGHAYDDIDDIDEYVKKLRDGEA